MALTPTTHTLKHTHPHPHSHLYSWLLSASAFSADGFYLWTASSIRISYYHTNLYEKTKWKQEESKKWVEICTMQSPTDFHSNQLCILCVLCYYHRFWHSKTNIHKIIMSLCLYSPSRYNKMPYTLAQYPAWSGYSSGSSQKKEEKNGH